MEVLVLFLVVVGVAVYFIRKERKAHRPSGGGGGQPTNRDKS